MPKHPAAGFIEHIVSQSPVHRDPPRLFPDGIAGRRRDPVNDDTTDFTFGVSDAPWDDDTRPGRRSQYSRPWGFGFGSSIGVQSCIDW